jgi:hypothetical protein
LGGRRVAGQLGAEGVVEEVADLPGVAGDGVDQVADLVDQQRPEGGHEHDHPDDQGREHGRGGQPPAPAPPGQDVGRRLQGEGQEQRDHQHHQQAAQPHRQPEGDVQGGRPGEQEHHVPGGPPVGHGCRAGTGSSSRSWLRLVWVTVGVVAVVQAKHHQAQHVLLLGWPW